MSGTRAKLIELFDRGIDIVKGGTDRDFYSNGRGNLYPNKLDKVINNSPTAKPTANVFKNFIIGSGLTKDYIINKRNNATLSDLVDAIGDDISRQYGSFIWVGYGYDEGGDIVPKNYKVLDYTKCRIEKKDDDGRPAKIIYKNWESNSWMRRVVDAKRFYPYNPNQAIVKSQMKAETPDGTVEEQVENYRGQVFYLNLTPQYVYALSKFDNVFNDMDSEYRFSLYVNTQMRTGWVGKTVILTQGLDEEKEEQITKDLSKLLGAENSGNAYHLGVDNAEDLNNVMQIKQVKAQFDDKLFVNSDERIRRNITGAANNLPEQLVYAGTSLFGTGGDALREYKNFYNEQTQGERKALNRALTRLKIDSEIIPI